jgi:hypothetical protein
MFNHANLTDMYSVADPERCKQYIVVASTALESIFSKVNINPIVKDGTLYFQSVPGLIESMHPEDKARRQASCNMLAFYFIRIFQIFGALTLAVKDSTIPSVDPAMNVPRNIKRGYTPLVSRPLRGFPSANQPRSFWSGGQRGGELTQRSSGTYYINNPSGDQDYRILNNYLNNPSSSSSTAPMYFNSNMYIPQESLYDGVPDARVLKPNPTPIVIYRYTGSDKVYQIIGRLSIATDGTTYNVTLTDIKVDGKPSKVTRKEDSLNSDYSGDRNPLNDKRKNLPDALADMFKSIIGEDLGFSTIEFLSDRKYINMTDSPATIKGTTVSVRDPRSVSRSAPVPIIYSGTTKVDGRSRDISITAALRLTNDGDKYIMYIDFSKSLSKPDIGDLPNKGPIIFRGRGDPATDKGTRIPTYIQKVFEEIVKGGADGTQTYRGRPLKGPPSSDRIPAHLRIDGLWKALAKAPPAKTLCIGRAMQLLNVNAIKGALSPMDFSNACNMSFPLAQNGSVPANGGRIADVPSISALASLYKDIDGRAVSDYGPFKEALNQVYETTAEVDSIRFKAPDTCVENGVTTVPIETKSQIRSIVKGLIQQQKKFSRQALQVIFMLFEESYVRKGIFMFNRNVALKGMPEIERIAGIARKLLATQLVSCEIDYKKGVELLKGARVTPVEAKPVPENKEDEEEI